MAIGEITHLPNNNPQMSHLFDYLYDITSICFAVILNCIKYLLLLLGYQDFLPAKTNRSKENRGFELYSDLMDRAARWIARQQGVRFTNIQTVAVKIKKCNVFNLNIIMLILMLMLMLVLALALVLALVS